MAVNTNSIEQSMPPRQRRRARLKTRVPGLDAANTANTHKREPKEAWRVEQFSRRKNIEGRLPKEPQWKTDPRSPTSLSQKQKIFIWGCAKTEQNEGTQEKPNFERNGAGSEKPTTLTNNFGRSEIWWFTESDEKKSFERIWLFAAWRQNGIWRGVKWKSNFEAKAAKWSKMQSTFTLRQF